ncbi:hypothetical protein BC826DRAFT_1060468, partial [Russula brevipes]
MKEGELGTRKRMGRGNGTGSARRCGTKRKGSGLVRVAQRTRRTKGKGAHGGAAHETERR